MLHHFGIPKLPHMKYDQPSANWLNHSPTHSHTHSNFDEHHQRTATVTNSQAIDAHAPAPLHALAYPVQQYERRHQRHRRQHAASKPRNRRGDPGAVRQSLQAHGRYRWSRQLLGQHNAEHFGAFKTAGEPHQNADGRGASAHPVADATPRFPGASELSCSERALAPGHRCTTGCAAAWRHRRRLEIVCRRIRATILNPATGSGFAYV